MDLKELYWTIRNKLSPTGIFQDCFEQFVVLVTYYGSFWRPMSARMGSSVSVTTKAGETRRNVLIVSYYSPPYKSYFGTQRLAKFIKYLSRNAWNITLITTQPHSVDQADDIDEDRIPTNVEVVRLKPVKSRSLARLGMICPDDYISWIRPALKEIKRVVKDRKIDIVFATAPPYSNLLVAAICSRLFAIPFVSDFRDPWSKVDIFWRLKNPISRFISRALEKSVLRASSALIMADDSKYAEDFFIDVNPLYNLVSINNGFDDEDFQTCNRRNGQQPDKKFVLSYVGTFYNEKTFRPLVAALGRWFERFPKDAAQVVFEFAGNDGGFWGEVAGLPMEAKHHGYVAHREAISIRERSTLQLFAQPPEFKPHVLSGKIFEMIRTDVPIVAITNTRGAVADLISRTGTGFVVEPNNPQEIATLLKELYESWRAGTLRSNSNREAVMEYSRQAAADKLARVFDQVIGS